MASLFNAVSEPDAIGLLKQDHRKVEALFKQFEQSNDGDEKIELAQQICQELTVHALVEEREFYPKLLDAFDEEGDDLIKEAEVEHATLKMLIAEIDGSTSDDRLFDANVKVLKEYVQHHVREEENEIMPKARSADVDLQAMGERIQKLKERLMAQMMEAAEGQRSRGKSRVRVAKPGTRGASKRTSRGSARKRTATKRTARTSTASRGGRKSASSRGNGRTASSRGNGSSASSRSNGRGKSALRASGRGGARSGRSASSRSGAASRGGASRGGSSSRGGRASASR